MKIMQKKSKMEPISISLTEEDSRKVGDLISDVVLNTRKEAEDYYQKIDSLSLDKSLSDDARDLVIEILNSFTTELSVPMSDDDFELEV